MHWFTPIANPHRRRGMRQEEKEKRSVRIKTKENMQQFTQKQAIAVFDSMVWRNWTNEQIAGVQLFQDYLLLPIGELKRALSAILDRPVYTHELSQDSLQKEFLSKHQALSFDEFIRLLPVEVRLNFVP